MDELISYNRIELERILSLSLPIMIIAIVCVSITNPSQAFSMYVSNGEQAATLEIDLTYVNGDRADYHGIALKIYQDNSNVPFKTIPSLSGNPYNISLPLGHRYKIETYSSSMLANIGYVDLENNNEKLKLGMPVPGSIRFNVLYNDGYTPIDNATVMIASTDGTYEYWTNSTTDASGNTIRFWLQPTISNDNYYKANVFLGNGLLYSYYPLSVLPGLSDDLKLVTPWPAELPPITVSVYKSPYQTVSKEDGNFVVRLYDNNGNEISESKINAIGKTTFSNLKVGRYFFHVIDLNNDNYKESNKTVILDGKQNSVQIFQITDSTAIQDNSIADPNPSVPQTQIPIWVKNNARWWAQNQVNDSDFISGIQYLVQQGIMKITPIDNVQDSSNKIPPWVKSNAAWWAKGQISNNDFIKGIQYLISNGMMRVQHDSTLPLTSVSSLQSDG